MPRSKQPRYLPPACGTRARFASPFRPAISSLRRGETKSSDRYPASASPEQIRNHNTLVISQAESQWLHVPGVAAAYGDGPSLPIALELFGGYSADESRRRHHLGELLEKLLDAEPKQRRRQVLIAEWVRRPNSTRLAIAARVAAMPENGSG